MQLGEVVTKTILGLTRSEMFYFIYVPSASTGKAARFFSNE